MIFLQLFITFFKIGILNFGGGYAMISFIQNEVVFKHAWLTTLEFTDVVAISQVTPGPVGINMATYTGYTVGHGLLGAFVATFAVCFPSFILMLLISNFLSIHKENPYVKGVFKLLRPAVVGLIAAAALSLCSKENFVDIVSIMLFVVSFFAVLKFKLNPILILLFSGFAGLIFY